MSRAAYVKTGHVVKWLTLNRSGRSQAAFCWGAIGPPSGPPGLRLAGK